MEPAPPSFSSNPRPMDRFRQAGRHTEQKQTGERESGLARSLGSHNPGITDRWICTAWVGFLVTSNRQHHVCTVVSSMYARGRMIRHPYLVLFVADDNCHLLNLSTSPLPTYVPTRSLVESYPMSIKALPIGGRPLYVHT